MDKNSKIYVAGHLGLVGSAIAAKLRKGGYENLVLKSRTELDLLNQVDVKQFFEEEKPEYVILAAAKVGGIIANSTCRAQFIYENLQIQNNVIHIAYLCGVKKLLFLGSTCIYPKLAAQPMKEDCLLTDDLEYSNEPYAIAKIAGLKMCESYNLQYNTNFISVMPTNLYGPNDNFNLETSHVLPALIRKMYLAKSLMESDWLSLKKDLSKRPIESIDDENSKSDIIQVLEKYGIIKGEDGNVILKLWGSGKPLREFLWSEDMAEACVFLLENRSFSDIVSVRNSEVKNTHINIGTGKEISIKDLAELIKEIIGFKGDLFFDIKKPDGTMRKLTDPSKIHKLGWKHSMELNQGIHKLFNWYKKYI